MIWIVWAIVWAIGLMCTVFIVNHGGGSFLIVLALYFLPAIIAALREHNNAGAILVLNLFLGWTVLGWVLALVWACTNNCMRKLEDAR